MIEDYEDEEFFEQNEEEFVDDYNSWENEPGWDSYEKYGGYNGYDDFTIDTVFEGDPEATWNVDWKYQQQCTAVALVDSTFAPSKKDNRVLFEILS